MIKFIAKAEAEIQRASIKLFDPNGKQNERVIIKFILDCCRKWNGSILEILREL
jgi:hypothetical protein